MIHSILKKLALSGVAMLSFIDTSIAQVDPSSELYQTLKTKDSLMFDKGFNQCDLEQLEAVLPEKFEFYHDSLGVLRSRKAFIDTIKKNVCHTGQPVVKRVLDASSMSVFALYDRGRLYGAIQSGKHAFGETQARFTNLWLFEDGTWYPKRILSYDHISHLKFSSKIQHIPISFELAKLYLGHYQFSPDFVLSIINEDGQLYGDSQGQKVAINAIEKHQFVDQSEQIKLTFNANKTGKIVSVTMQGPQGTMNANRIDHP